jgi:hypothetical protein
MYAATSTTQYGTPGMRGWLVNRSQSSRTESGTMTATTKMVRSSDRFMGSFAGPSTEFGWSSSDMRHHPIARQNRGRAGFMQDARGR